MARKRYHQSAEDRMHESRGMKKRSSHNDGAYHQSAEDRMHESRAMKKRSSHNDYTEGHYEGMDHRRRMEYEDSMMIREDPHEIANLPQRPMIKKYAESPYSHREQLDDTVRGVDEQMYEDTMGGDRKKDRYPEKY